MTEPALKLNFLSHGTLQSYDIAKSRKFYEEFLGLEVVQTSPGSLMIRLGGNNTIATVLNPRKEAMPMLGHNGLDVATREEVDRAHAICAERKEQWGIKSVTRPADQHGTYSFYFRDLDDNWWEILTNPDGGYAWMFKKGGDIDNWGAGEGEGYNPNDFTKRRYK
jgi:catechol 2,3-dioxygenase-like lactoylglutathione lyase family enzyme